MKYLMATIKNHNLAFEEIEDNLKEYYNQIDCELIEMHEIKIGQNYYTFVMDEEAKLNNKYVNVLLLHNNQIIDVLNGHIIIQKYDFENDHAVDLTIDDQREIKNWINSCLKMIDFSQCCFVPTLEL